MPFIFRLSVHVVEQKHKPESSVVSQLQLRRRLLPILSAGSDGHKNKVDSSLNGKP